MRFIIPLSKANRVPDDLEKAGPHKYISRKKVKGKWVYKYRETKKREKATDESKVPGKTRRHWVKHKPGLPEQTVAAYRNPDGSYKAERKPLHDKIISEFLDGVKPPKSGQKVALVMMGGTASGKTSIAKAMVGEAFKDFANVNPDDVKEKMPEYNEALEFEVDGKKASAQDAAHMVHAESSDIAMDVYSKAIDGGLNILLDGTGRKKDRHEAQIRQLQELGYKVQLLMPDVDQELAISRAMDRAEETGRFVPAGPPPPGQIDVVRPMYAQIPKNFEPLARVADSFAMYDTTEWPPTLKWEGAKGEPDKIHDPEFVDRFRKKAGNLGKSIELSKSDKGGAEPAVTPEEVQKRIEGAKPLERKPKKFDRHVGAEHSVEDLDYTKAKPIRYQ